MDASEKARHDARLIPPGNTLPFILVTALFMFWGIPGNLNDILIKQFMKSFEITRLEAGLVQSAFYIGYFILAIPAAMIMRKYSYKTGLIIGMLLFSTGTFLFWPAAHAGQYIFFLMALFVIASGLSFLETGANPFIANLGNPDSSERRLNFSQAFNPIGAILGVGAGTLFILSGKEPNGLEIEAMKAAGTYQSFLQSEIMRVVTPYMVIGTIIFLWAIWMMRTPFPKIQAEQEDPNHRSKFSDLIRFPHFIKGVFAQFCYVGAQVGTWSYFIQYSQDYTGIPEKTAGLFLTGTLVAFGVGRFSATYIMRFFEPRKLMGIYSLVNIVLVSVAIIHPGWIGVWCIFFTSFFMSLMFPTIFALGIKGLGPHTKIAGSMIVMSIIGGAVFTPLIGLVAAKSMAHAMIFVLFCYIVVAFYSYRGAIPKNIMVSKEDDTKIAVSH